jgi:hypothetical protein
MDVVNSNNPEREYSDEEKELIARAFEEAFDDEPVGPSLSTLGLTGEVRAIMPPSKEPRTREQDELLVKILNSMREAGRKAREE